MGKAFDTSTNVAVAARPLRVGRAVLALVAFDADLQAPITDEARRWASVVLVGAGIETGAGGVVAALGRLAVGCLEALGANVESDIAAAAFTIAIPETSDAPAR